MDIFLSSSFPMLHYIESDYSDYASCHSDYSGYASCRIVWVLFFLRSNPTDFLGVSLSYGFWRFFGSN